MLPPRPPARCATSSSGPYWTSTKYLCLTPADLLDPEENASDTPSRLVLMGVRPSYLMDDLER